MINIRNTQRLIPLDIERIRNELSHILSLLKYQDFDLGVWFTTNNTIRRYNNQYRHKNKPTDILSFPYHPELKAGQRIRVISEEDRNLGDLIISPAYVQREAEQLQVPFDQRLRLIIVHGICHLLGYDHITDQDYRRMRAKEAWILKKLA